MPFSFLLYILSPHFFSQTSSCEYKQEMEEMKIKAAKWLFCLKKFGGLGQLSWLVRRPDTPTLWV